ncbi:MAG TPA: TetR/AcrR family transcriptional regulator [Solirubrobacterales bacterium]|nr:TetR/AcrR family transcriptional regulator [Solirubrobacterales bacterium]
MQYLSQRLASKPSPGRGAGLSDLALPSPQRERILDAAERLIAERGCVGTSIEAIVKEAGVSSVTFYEFFESKEECFAVAFDRAVAWGVDQMAAAIREAGEADELSWPEQVATGLRATTRLIVEAPERARLCLVEAQTGGPELESRFETALDRLAAKLREGRALPTASVDLPASHEEATAAGLAWLLRERLEMGVAAKLGELYPELIDIALAPYLGAGESRPAVPATAQGNG